MNSMVSSHPRRAPSLPWDGWTIGAALLALLAATPLLAVAWMALNPTENIWPHLLSTVLPRRLGTTLLLMALVGACSAIIGVATAWLVTMTRFPGRPVFAVMLLAPLAMPGYIAAYAMTDLLEYAGPVQTALRDAFGWRTARDYWFPQIRSLGGAATVLTFTLYPYTYLLARAAFQEQSSGAIEVARSLGCGPWEAFRRVALPLARPAIVVGAAMAMMEAMNDFGAVEFFAVRTLTTTVFATWLEGRNVGGAAQIACVMLALMVGILAIERAGRRGAKYHASARRQRPVEPVGAGPLAQVGAFIACLIPIAIGFLIPAGVLFAHTLDRLDAYADPAFLRAAGHTILLSGAAAALTIGAAVFLVYGARAAQGRSLRVFARVASLGYATPAAVMAVGVLIPFAAFDNALNAVMKDHFGASVGLLLTGGVGALLFAYCVRFLAIAHGGVEGAFGRVTPTMEMAARTLGETRGGTLRRIYLPITRGTVLSAALLVFVDAAKELPLTLFLSPFNFQTLATQVYGFASLEQIQDAAPAALAIVLVGLAPVALLSRSLRTGAGAR